MAQQTVKTRPSWWPHFNSTLRSTAVTARLGLVLGIAIGINFLTGLLSLYQYQPWSWLPEPAAPAWGYRLTQGIHVTTGLSIVPLLFFKLWSVYPDKFRWPPLRSIRHAAERLSFAILVSAILVQVTTGLLNVLNWYPFPWDFVSVHHYLAFVIVGSVLLHVGIKLPDIGYGLKAKVAEADVLTEIPWWDNPDSHSNAGDLPAPTTPGISRRGLLTAAGVGIGTVTLTVVGQSATPLEPISLLSPRKPTKGPQGCAVHRTADEAKVMALATAPDWTLKITGPQPYQLTLAEIEAMPTQEAMFPIACIEGWSTDVRWRGISLLDLIKRAGGNADSRVRFQSLETHWFFSHSEIFGPQLSKALLATHINGERLNIDHGYPLRLIAPDRAGAFNTKWLSEIKVL
jgi:hypothetical protein